MGGYSGNDQIVIETQDSASSTRDSVVSFVARAADSVVSTEWASVVGERSNVIQGIEIPKSAVEIYKWDL